MHIMGRKYVLITSGSEWLSNSFSGCSTSFVNEVREFGLSLQ